MTPITRRSFTVQSLGAATLGLSAPARKPNIVYIMFDDQGTADAACFGSKEIHTPNIDRLAAEGMKFDNAYSGCTVCAPARSTLMTGTHMGHTSVRTNPGGVPIRAEDFTVAQMLAKPGYVSGGFGKWGLGDLDTEGVPERHGFNKFYGYYHQVHAHYFYPEYLIDTGKKVPLPGNAGFYSPEPDSGAFSLKGPGGEHRQFSGYLIFDEMKKWIRDNKDRSFFCYAPWTLPHGRYEIPDSDPAWALYKDKPWSMRARVHAAYITAADRMVGETMALLKELGLDSNTLVIYASDNGAPNRFEGELDSTGGLRGMKTSLYEGGIRVPFVARWPGRIKAGAVSDAPIYFPDMMPTFADVAGARDFLPTKLDGVSVAPELFGKGKVDRNRTMYWEMNRSGMSTNYGAPKQQACRHGQWKLVRDQADTPWELYDLSADGAETRNLAAEHPKIVRELAAWMDANRTDPPPQVEPSKPAGQRWR